MPELQQKAEVRQGDIQQSQYILHGGGRLWNKAFCDLHYFTVQEQLALDKGLLIHPQIKISIS